MAITKQQQKMELIHQKAEHDGQKAALEYALAKGEITMLDFSKKALEVRTQYQDIINNIMSEKIS